MNKIFKSIWNHVTRTFTAASEIQQTKGKKARSTAVALVAPAVLMSSPAWAYNGEYSDTWNWGAIDGTEIFLWNNSNETSGLEYLHTLVIGGSDAARDYGTLKSTAPVWGTTYTLHITDEGSSLNLDNWNGSLFSQSTVGHSQIIIRAEDWSKATYLKAEDIEVINDNNSVTSNEFRQSLVQNNRNKATATYLIGEEVINRLNTNIIDGNGHSPTGIYDVEDDNANVQGLWMATLLKSVSINSDEVLNLTVDGATEVWSAQILGNGGISYTGDSASSTLLTLRDTFGFGTNNYYGPTNIDSISLDLNRKNAFGQASSITASDAVININQSDAWTSAGGLHLTDSTVNFTAAQSGFTVTNDNSEETTNTATFSGANTISGGANSFTYLIRGDAQVVDGTTTFAGTNIKTQVAGSLILHSVGGIANDTAIEIGGALNFVGAGATPTKQTLTQTFAAYDDTDDKYTVNLSKGSNIKYASGSILSGVLTTSLSDVSKLETDNQSNLGNLVMFNRQSDKARSLLTDSRRCTSC